MMQWLSALTFDLGGAARTSAASITGWVYIGIIMGYIGYILGLYWIIFLKCQNFGGE